MRLTDIDNGYTEEVMHLRLDLEATEDEQDSSPDLDLVTRDLVSAAMGVVYKYCDYSPEFLKLMDAVDALTTELGEDAWSIDAMHYENIRYQLG